MLALFGVDLAAEDASGYTALSDAKYRRLVWFRAPDHPLKMRSDPFIRPLFNHREPQNQPRMLMQDRGSDKAVEAAVSTQWQAGGRLAASRALERCHSLNP